MNDPLSNPLDDQVLEAAVQIQMAIDLAGGADMDGRIEACRSVVSTSPSAKAESYAMVNEAARQVDRLRDIGALPPRATGKCDRRAKEVGDG